MEEIYTHIANLGFPIVISIYLLVRIEGKLNQLTESINELSNTIGKKDDWLSVIFFSILIKAML